MADPPAAKRRRELTKSEALEQLEKNGDVVKQLVEEMIEELTPFDMSDSHALLLEVRLERLGNIPMALSSKVYRLHKDFKAQKFRRDLLNEQIILCS